jgi:hypothetical protein
VAIPCKRKDFKLVLISTSMDDPHSLLLNIP